jgi:hypothetical protein
MGQLDSTCTAPTTVSVPSTCTPAPRGVGGGGGERVEVLVGITHVLRRSLRRGGHERGAIACTLHSRGGERRGGGARLRERRVDGTVRSVVQLLRSLLGVAVQVEFGAVKFETRKSPGNHHEI